MNLRKCTWALLMAFAILFLACEKNDDIQIPGEIETGLEVNKVELKLGESKHLAPKVLADGEVSYKWILNKKVIATSPEYTFEAEEEGFYSLVYEVENEGGKSSVTYDIAVVSEIQIGLIINLELGESSIFAPEVTPSEGVSYQWTLNDELVGNEAKYEFLANEIGDFSIYLEVSSITCHKVLVYHVKVKGLYENGLFVVNEGWYGHEGGSVNFFDFETNDFDFKIFQNQNSEKELGITTQYACIEDSKLYLVSKEGSHLVVTDVNSMKEIARVSLPGSEQARAFTLAEESLGFISTSDGIYKVDLTDYTIGDKLEGLSGEFGNILVKENHMYALQANQIVIVNLSDYSIAKTIAFEEDAGGMVEDKDGNIWVAAEYYLFKINPRDLTSKQIEMENNVSVNPSYGWAWNAGSLTYSESNNTLYFVNTGAWSANTASSFEIDTERAKKILELDPGYTFYGAGVFVDPATDKLYATANQGWGDGASKNRFYIFNLEGTNEMSIDYEGFYFPALFVAK